MTMNNKKEKNNCKRTYLRLINYLLHHIKSTESHKRIFRFVQDEAMNEIRDKGG